MKYLKRFNESLVNKDEISNFCRRYSIPNFKINDDGSVDVTGNVYLSNKVLSKLPIKFGKVTGSFFCNDNKLTSLDGSPESVGGDFNCNFNQLTSLIGSPKDVIGRFGCSDNQLTSLIGGPERVGGDYNCVRNRLTSLEGSPKSVGRIFMCNNNKIISLIGCPDFIGDLYCNDNPVTVIWDLFKSNNRFLEKINHIYTDLHLGDGWTIQGDIIEQIAEEIKIELPTNWEERLENIGYKII